MSYLDTHDLFLVSESFLLPFWPLFVHHWPIDLHYFYQIARIYNFNFFVKCLKQDFLVKEKEGEETIEENSVYKSLLYSKDITPFITLLNLGKIIQ